MTKEIQKEKKTTNVLVGLRIAQQSDALSPVLPLVLPAGSFENDLFSLLFSFYICCYLISSIYCNAKQFKRTFHQSFPECYPEDGWNTVTYLDNSQSNTETDFKFTQSIGIEILQLSLRILHKAYKGSKEAQHHRHCKFS